MQPIVKAESVKKSQLEQNKFNSSDDSEIFAAAEAA